MKIWWTLKPWKDVLTKELAGKWVILLTLSHCEDKIQNAVLTAMGTIFASRNELAIRWRNPSSPRDTINFRTNSERGEDIMISVSLESVSESHNTKHVLNQKRLDPKEDFARREGFVLSGNRFGRQPHTHHTVTGQTTETNQIH